MEVWIGRDGERHGPYKEVDVRQWLRSGQVSQQDLGWREGMADWQPLSSIFPEEIPATPPAFSPPPVPPRATAPEAPQTFDDAAPLTDYASFWQRFGAWVIDLLVLLVPSMIISYATGGIDAYMHMLSQVQANADLTGALEEYARATSNANIAVIGLGFLYYTLFEASKWQATPGKMALRLRVTDLEGHRLSLGRAATRNVVRLFNLATGLIPFVCYIAVAWTQRKQGLHDMFARALVLNGRTDSAPAPKAGTGHKQGSFDA